VADRYSQPSLTQAGTPLREVTFVVLDLETTGGAPDGNGITEIGAVKVRGGEQLGEFATLVNPGGPIPPFITVLTGITEAMVAPAPTIAEALPPLLEFLAGAVFVAHNAPFDTGFLRAACQLHGYRWPSPRVLDTAALARRVLTDEEVPNRRLGTLAAHFRTATTPTHRAFDDARATVEVLHALIGRLGSHKVYTLEDAIEFAKAISPEQRRKRHLADGLPDAPGVYIFRDARGRALYVGTSGSIATRVRSYFTASETRKRMSEMIHIAERVDALVCAHSLEAEVRELRLIAAHKPPYNRRSKFPERTAWLKLTPEAYPRLSFVGAVRADGGVYLGPFASRHSAELAADAVYEVLPLRRCSQRLSTRRPTGTCALADIGRCAAPCDLRIDPESYDRVAAEPFRRAVMDDPGALVQGLLTRIERLATLHRYEDAARVRVRLAALLRAAVRMQRLTALTRLAEVVAAAQGRLGAGRDPVRPAGGGRGLRAHRAPAGDAGRADGHRRDGAIRSGTDAVCQRGGDRARARLAGALRRTAGRVLRRLGLPVRRGGALRRPADPGRDRRPHGGSAGLRRGTAWPAPKPAPLSPSCIPACRVMVGVRRRGGLIMLPANGNAIIYVGGGSAPP
jgi:DNA polymerase-3 subunit epsilon